MNCASKVFLTIVVSCFIHFPFFILCILPLSCYRLSISVLAKVFKPDLIELIDSRNALLAVDDLETRPLSSVLIIALFEGESDFSRFCTLYEDRIVKAKFAGSDKLRFPELQQYYEYWMGYLFWKKDAQFNLQNHIKLISVENTAELTSDSLLQISKRLEKEAFEANHSPWKIFVIESEFQVEEAGSKKWGLIFKFHHSLADGYALVNSFMEITDTDRNKIILAKPRRRSMNYGLLTKVIAYILAPFIATAEVIENIDSNIWHSADLQLSRNWHIICSKKIPLETIKAIKNANNVSFTAVLIAGISGGIRKFFQINNLPNTGCMHALMSQPWPDHPMKFGRNHWTFGYMSLRIDEANKLKMLEITNKMLEGLKNSLAPVVNYILFPILGALPSCLIRMLFKNIVPTMFITSIPAAGNFGQIGIMGNSKMIDVRYWAGHTTGNVGLSFCFISYDKDLQFVMTIDEKLIEWSHNAIELATLIESEIINLYQETLV